ncbi:MAG: YicC/YloC family endoribonuclease [Gemmatimonadota bacterium]
MIRSMTGFGEAERETAAGRLRCEVKTVNHRYFSANLRMSAPLERFEPQIRESLRALMPRGHVNCSVRLNGATDSGAVPALALDEPRARQYLDLLQELKERFHLPGEVDIALLSRFGELIRAAEPEDVAALAADDIRTVTEAAARAAVAMREVEGQKLAADLIGRLGAIEIAMGQIAQRAPDRLVSERDRMRRVVSELTGAVGVDEDRITREIAHLAERLDISEELVRLRAHSELFRSILAQAGDDPVGKRLGFLTQEMHREANTIGSKANDSQIEHQVIAIKDEIERLREQIENIE